MVVHRYQKIVKESLKDKIEDKLNTNLRKLTGVMTKVDLLSKLRQNTVATLATDTKTRKALAILMNLFVFDLIPFEKLALSKVTGANTKLITLGLGLLQLRKINQNRDTFMGDFVKAFKLSDKVLIVFFLLARMILPKVELIYFIRKLLKVRQIESYIPFFSSLIKHKAKL